MVRTPEGELGAAVAAPWSQFVQSLHVRLQLPETWGVILVGIAGVMLCVLLLSGVLAHPGLIRDAFRWRSGASGACSKSIYTTGLVYGDCPFIS